jgi:hypothetical protein
MTLDHPNVGAVASRTVRQPAPRLYTARKVPPDSAENERARDVSATSHPSPRTVNVRP